MRIVIMALLAALLMVNNAFAEPVIHGIQRTLPYYVRHGLMTADEQAAIVQAIAQGKLVRKFVPVTRHGTNYWIYLSGQLGHRLYPCDEDPLVTGYDGVKGRWARSLTVCGKEWVWFETCDNLVVLEPICIPPPKVEPPCPPPAEPPHETVVPIPPCQTPAPPPPVVKPKPAPALPCITPIGPAPRPKPVEYVEYSPVVIREPLAFGKSALVKGQMPYTVYGNREEVTLSLFRYWERPRSQRICPPHPPGPPPDNCGPLPPDQTGPDGHHPINPPPSSADMSRRR